MSKILCTGAAGFVGSHVVEKLLAVGHEVWCVDDLSTGKRANLPKGVEFAKVDITNWFDILSEFVNCEPEYVIHLAAQPSLCASVDNPIKDAHINIMGTLNVLRATQKIGAKRVIMASTSAVYQEKSDGIYLESDRLFPESPYGTSKMAAECYVRQLALPEGGVVLRLGNVYGPRQVPIGENQVVPKMILHFEKGEKFYIHGDGEHRRDYVYVEDVAEAFLQALISYAGIYNIGSGKSYSVNDVAKEIATLYEIPEYHWEHDEVEDPRRAICLDSSCAQLILNWSAKTELSEGLKRTVAWWKTK